MIIGVVRTLQKFEVMRINFDNLRRDASAVTVASNSQTGGCCTICDMQGFFFLRIHLLYSVLNFLPISSG